MDFTCFRYETSGRYKTYMRSGLLTYSEGLSDGRWINRGFDANGFIDRDHFSDRALEFPETKPEAFQLVIDGQSLHFGWSVVGITEIEKDRHLVVELKSDLRPIRVKLHTRIDGTAILSRALEIINDGPAPAALSHLAVWSGVITQMGDWQRQLPPGDTDLFTLGHIPGPDWGIEGNYTEMTLPKGRYALTGVNGRSGHGNPFFVLRNNALGLSFIGALAWSANWKIEFYHNVTTRGEHAWVELAAGPDAAAPMRVLAPGETLLTPTMHLGCSFGHTDDLIHELHTHIRRSVMPAQPTGRDFRIVYNHWAYVLHELTETALFNEIDTAADVGAELFIIDAGWYADANTDWWQTVGDWQVGNRLPRGLAPFRKYAHEKGLLFGIWCEIERAGMKSLLAEKHPDWFMTRYGQPIQTSLDLTRPAVADYVESTIDRLITEHELDLFRLDYNASTFDGGQNTRDGFFENTHFRYCEALYGIFDRIREKYPNVILENCSSGGGRTDLGLVSRFHHTWVTDYQVAPRSIKIVNGMSMVLPPEYIDRNCGVGQDSHVTGDLTFQIRSCMLGHFTLTGFYPSAGFRNPAQIDFVRHCTDLYKNFIRPMLPSCKVIHHTPILPERNPNGWCVIEYGSPDATRALAALFRLAGPAAAEYNVRFRSLDPGRTYRVTYDNSRRAVEVSGIDLIERGLTIRLETPLTSELLLLEATK